MKKIINLLLSFIFILALLIPSFTQIALATGPDVVANLVAANYQPAGSFTDTTNAQIGSRVQIYLEISNRTAGVDATNLHVKVNLPSGSASTQTVGAAVSGSNFSPSSSDNTIINITNGSGKLVYVSGSTTLTWTSGSGPTYSNNVMPDDLTTSGFDFVPALQPGTPYSIQLAFLADIVQTSGGGGSSSQTSQGGPSAGDGKGPAQAPVCTDAKPDKTTLKTVTKENATAVKLTWSKVASATSYAIRFGTESKKYQYGVAKTGNTDNYIVGSLNPNSTYFFTVLPINGCMPGEWSNELSTANVGGRVLTGTAASLGTSMQSEEKAASTAGASVLESTSSATASALVSPTPQPAKKTGVNWQGILIVLGLGVLGAGAYTYYKSLPKKIS